MMTFAGVDIGTQGVKAAFYSEDGKCLSESFEPSRPRHPCVGAVEEDPEFQVASACRMLKRCSEASGINDLAAVGIAGQMAGVIGIGEDGLSVTPYDSWLDTRCAPQMRRMQEAAGNDVLRATGNAPSFNHGPKILWWKEEHPETYGKVSRFVQPGGYVAMRLTGLKGAAAFIDGTYLHFSGFANNMELKWSEELCERFGVAKSKLPQIVNPTAIVGAISGRMAGECGIAPGTPVVAGCGDTAASFLACGATSEGICVDVAGTASVFGATAGAFTPDVRSGILGTGRAATDGLWHPYAYVNGGGMNLEWFRREFCAGASYEELNDLAAAIEPADSDPMFIPHLGGRVSPGWPSMRGAWAGLTWDHRRGHFYRAALESVALEYALYQSALRALLPGVTFAELRITGGGEKSSVWNQMKADVLGMPIVQIENGGGAPMGAAMLAGVAAMKLRSPSDLADRWVRLGRRFEPDASRRTYYQIRIARYEALIEMIHEWSEI